MITNFLLAIFLITVPISALMLARWLDRFVEGENQPNHNFKKYPITKLQLINYDLPDRKEWETMEEWKENQREIAQSIDPYFFANF